MPNDPVARRALSREEALQIIYPRTNRVQGQRFTQDTPVTPDVWLLFATSEPDTAHEVLFAPHRDSTLEKLVRELRISLSGVGGLRAPVVIYNQSHAMAKVTFQQLIQAILPLSVWWTKELPDHVLQQLPLLLEEKAQLTQLLINPAELRQLGDKEKVYSETLLHMVRIAGALSLCEPMPASDEARRDYFLRAVRSLQQLLSEADVNGLWTRLKVVRGVTKKPQASLWKIFLNREAESAVYVSRQTVKADAATQVFKISCEGLLWAVVDSGVDAAHPGFGGDKDVADSRIVKTFDFTRLKDLLYTAAADRDHESAAALEAQIRKDAGLDEGQWNGLKQDLQLRLASGRFFEWDLLERILRIEHTADAYRPPENQHGTHVAGILAANWNRSEDTTTPNHAGIGPGDIKGICPDLQIYDLRVFTAEGTGDEFSILAALQFIRYLNANKDTVSVHGVNMSFSLKHSVDSYACGATPVCEECTRLTGAGVVVVTAAGNRGYQAETADGLGGYSDISITDPGNAEDAITVGSTHRLMPHKFGVSYFSSRGPTGDGRGKPDLLAPGEKIVSTIPGGKKAALDGTSMAAPHVSGAAALLMARHRELIGDPRRIKEILCNTATSLNRDKNFQGAGLLDILRALQSV